VLHSVGRLPADRTAHAAGSMQHLQLLTSGYKLNDTKAERALTLMNNNDGT
jgi:hypothetical protein